MYRSCLFEKLQGMYSSKAELCTDLVCEILRIASGKCSDEDTSSDSFSFKSPGVRTSVSETFDVLISILEEIVHPTRDLPEKHHFSSRSQKPTHILGLMAAIVNGVEAAVESLPEHQRPLCASTFFFVLQRILCRNGKDPFDCADERLVSMCQRMVWFSCKGLTASQDSGILGLDEQARLPDPDLTTLIFERMQPSHVFSVFSCLRRNLNVTKATSPALLLLFSLHLRTLRRTEAEESLSEVSVTSAMEVLHNLIESELDSSSVANNILGISTCMREYPVLTAYALFHACIRGTRQSTYMERNENNCHGKSRTIDSPATSSRRPERETISLMCSRVARICKQALEPVFSRNNSNGCDDKEKMNIRRGWEIRSPIGSFLACLLQICKFSFSLWLICKITKL